MIVNGKEVSLGEGTTLEKYLADNGYKQGYIAVERNGEIIRKNKYSETILNDSDKLEIVEFRGGG